MKYLKMFENMNDICIEISYDEYRDYKRSHTKDPNLVNIIISILRQEIPYNIHKLSPISPRINSIFVYTNNLYIDTVLPRSTPNKNIKIEGFGLFPFDDEYILIQVAITGAHSICFLCDGRDGLIEFLKNKIY
jgi:hypothetical protein